MRRETVAGVLTLVITLAVVVPLGWFARWVIETYGLGWGALFALAFIAACLGIAARVDIAKGRYQPRDLLRWPPRWIYSRPPPDKHP